ncbi:MAG: 2-5 ligase [Mucilaginibacter sp.]|nr:2-5 ligase [Mucilaginibacter sp.]
MDYKDYLTIISAPEHVDKKINLFKRSCGKHIGKFPGMYAKAHISFDIIRDRIDQVTKKPLTLRPFYELIDMKIRTIPARELKITGFDFFVHGPNFRTIYAALELDAETENWFHSIKQTLRINKKLRPHITITRKIPTESFNTLWPYFQKMEYQDSFEAEHLTILEKGSGNLIDHYKEYKKLPFGKKLTTL